MRENECRVRSTEVSEAKPGLAELFDAEQPFDGSEDWERLAVFRTMGGEGESEPRVASFLLNRKLSQSPL